MKRILPIPTTLILTLAPSFGMVTFTGDPSTTTGAGLVRLGNSLDSSIFAGNVGLGYSYDVYTGRYTVSSTDTASGTGLIGSTVGATGGSFDVGDEVYVIGWKSTQFDTNGGLVGATGDQFIKMDPNGNGGYLPSSAPGGPNTSFSGNSDPGDFQLQNSRNFGNDFRFSSFLFNEGGAGLTYPLQDGGANSAFTTIEVDLPFRAFGLLESGSGGPDRVISQTFLLNLTDLSASSFGGVDVNDFDNIAFQMLISADGDSRAFWAGGDTQVVIPEPATAILGALGSLLLLRRRR